MNSRTGKTFAWIIVLLASIVLIALTFLALSGHRGIVATTRLADGRILQIEGVSFGTTHEMGQKHWFYESFVYYMPRVIENYLRPKSSVSKISWDEPVLVVWVNALNSQTGKYVDCQGIRPEFVDSHGELFGQLSSSWFGHQSFWRVGHIYRVFPRTERMLTLQITPWGTNRTSQVQFANPAFTEPAAWQGEPLPQTHAVGDLEISLTGLRLATNGEPNNQWETPTRYWNPSWNILHHGQPASSWNPPEWTAEDPAGNRGQFLGEHQPILKYLVTVYPKATNADAATLVVTLPSVDPTFVTNVILWNQRSRFETDEITVLGLFPPGTHAFTEGKYDPNPPPSARMGPTRGGSPSGWVGTSQRVSASRFQNWSGHYTPWPVIYLSFESGLLDNRVAVRLRESNGQFLDAKPDGVGSGRIHPFLLKIPPGTGPIQAEVIVLKPSRCEFMVRTPAMKR